MIFAFLFAVFIGLCAVTFIGLEDAHFRVKRLLDELDEQATGPSTARDSFTRSLLALNKVDSLVPCDSPIPVPGESSSSESTHPVQSKDPVQVL